MSFVALYFTFSVACLLLGYPYELVSDDWKGWKEHVVIKYLAAILLVFFVWPLVCTKFYLWAFKE